MSTDSTFGSDPDRLMRLLSLGMETETVPDAQVNIDPLDVLLEKPGATIGRYELIEVLGEGGMGIVYLAQQQEPIKRQVALKIIKPGMDSRRVIARFQAEQQALAMMDHPHVARVYDGGLTASGRPYFVMEYVDGAPITHYCDNNNLTLNERLRLFLLVCEAVQHAHQKGIIHRDLKPSNIIVVEHKDEAIPKVIDFGIARALSRPLTELTLTTEHSRPIGTPEFMSPEQAKLGNSDIDIRSDVYSLGVILYRLLTGQLPFDANVLREGGFDEFRRLVAEEEPNPPSSRVRSIKEASYSHITTHFKTEPNTLARMLRGDLDWITLKALSRERDRRYTTVDAMALDIQRYLIHEPISAAPPKLGYRIGKFIHRHRTAVILIMSIALLTIGTFVSLWMYSQTQEAKRYAESVNHKQLLKEARDHYQNRQFELTHSKLESILNSAYVRRAARLLHAQTTIKQGKPTEAMTQLEEIIGAEDEISGQAHFLLAKLYDEIESLRQSKANNPKRQWHRQEAERLVPAIAQYYFLRRQVSLETQERLDLLRQSLKLDPSRIFGTIVNAGSTINSAYTDILPSISADGLSLYFTSDRPGGEGGWDIWVATRPSSRDQWSTPINLGLPVNTSDFEGCPSISADGLELYFSRGLDNHGDIFVAKRESIDAPWQTPTLLPVSINTTTATDWGPHISFDGRSLYFISTREDGVGGMDIWMIDRPEPHGPWSGCPLPIAPPINSPDIEARKCISADGRILFFQRLRRKNASGGKQAIEEWFYAAIRRSSTDAAWSEPIDLGPVLQGSKMPYICSLSADGSQLYLCDHPWTDPRPGGFGKCDIWILPISVSQ